ncbi:MAG TPA: hypothetical protein VI277_05790 [Candidatus Limnocylindria bacterium]
MIEGETTQSAKDAAPAQGAPEAAEQHAGGDPVAEAPPTEAPAGEPAKAAAAAAADATPEADASEPAASPEGGDEFMRDLVAAMRAVAEEARQTGVTELKARTDEQVLTLEAESELRKTELRRLADADVAGVGEWAAAEAERIKKEAEQRVVARRARLDQELAADAVRTEADAKAVRGRLAEYERELEAYHAQLGEINDPAAFAAAAKRLPKPPVLGGSAAAASNPTDATEAPTPEAAAPSAPEPASTNGVAAEADAGAEAPSTEVLASRMAELDAALPEGEPSGDADTSATAEPAADEAPAAPVAEAAEPAAAAPEGEAASAVAAATAGTAPNAGAEPTVTEVVVKGLGSFGAITGFRQSLSGVDGIDSVALSLGQTGEFVFRATHGVGFDVKAAIIALEGDGAKIESRPEGGLRVTLERAR